MLLDEPSLGLAPILVEEIFRIIKEINNEGVTVLLVEQNAMLALQSAEYGYVMQTGLVAREGPTEELLIDVEIREMYLGEIL